MQESSIKSTTLILITVFPPETSQNNIWSPLLQMMTFHPTSHRVSSVSLNQCYDYRSNWQSWRQGNVPELGSSLTGAWGLRKRSCQLCACGFLKESLTAQSEFINLTAINRALLCLLSAMVRACAVTSAGESQSHAVLLLFNEDTPVAKSHSKKMDIAPHFSELFELFFFLHCCAWHYIFFLSCKQRRFSHSLITFMQRECVINSPWARALISATSLNNLH